MRWSGRPAEFFDDKVHRSSTRVGQRYADRVRSVGHNIIEGKRLQRRRRVEVETDVGVRQLGQNRAGLTEADESG